MGKLDNVIKNIGHHPDASTGPAAPELLKQTLETPTTAESSQGAMATQKLDTVQGFQTSEDIKPTVIDKNIEYSSQAETMEMSSRKKIVDRSSVTTSVYLPNDAHEVSGFNVHPNIDLCRSKSIVEEEFKKLRTNLIYMMEKKDIKTFLFSSSRHAEGKTTTVLSLSRCFGEIAHLKTCVVDCDFRRPRLKNFFDLDVEVGIDDVLIKDLDVKDALIYSQKDNIYVLPTRRGHSNATELLGLDRMKAIVNVLREDFDLVLIDSSPCISTTDPFIIGSYVDAVSLMVKMRHTPKQSVEYTINLLRQKEIPFIGLVLTHHRGGYHSYLLQRYNYYSDYGYDNYSAETE